MAKYIDAYGIRNLTFHFQTTYKQCQFIFSTNYNFVFNYPYGKFGEYPYPFVKIVTNIYKKYLWPSQVKIIFKEALRKADSFIDSCFAKYKLQNTANLEIFKCIENITLKLNFITREIIKNLITIMECTVLINVSQQDDMSKKMFYRRLVDFHPQLSSQGSSHSILYTEC